MKQTQSDIKQERYIVLNSIDDKITKLQALANLFTIIGLDDSLEEGEKKAPILYLADDLRKIAAELKDNIDAVE